MRISRARVMLLSATITLAMWIMPAKSYDVFLSVTGVISGNTCTIASESKNIYIPLGNISNRQFLNVGDVSQTKTSFTIRLEECGPTFEGAKITFSGIADDNDSQYLKIDDGEASGIAVAIMDNKNEVIALNSTTSIYGLANQQSLDILFYARLVATKIPVTAGKVAATATYTVEYL